MIKIFYFLTLLLLSVGGNCDDTKSLYDTKFYPGKDFVTVKNGDTVLLHAQKNAFIGPYDENDLKVKMELKKKQGGFDVVYKIENVSDRAVLMPDLFVPGIKFLFSHNLDILSTNTKLYMQKRDIAQIDRNRNYFTVGSMIYKKRSGGYIEEEFYYGADTFSPYAPVIVARDEHFSVGASLIYPFLEYDYKGKKTRAKHRVLKNKLYPKMRIYRDKKDYRYAFLFAKEGYLKSLLSAKKSYVFVVSVRFSDTKKYINTLYPYKRFLSVTYPSKTSSDKNRDPIMAVNFAFYGSVTEKNKRGWAWGLEKKDKNGNYILPLKEVCAGLSGLMKKRGYKRIMFVTFSGVYDHKNSADLFDELPFQILTNLPENMHRELNESMEIFRSADQKVSFWWGIAGMMPVDGNDRLIADDTWQPYSDRPFDLWNAAERRYALRQLERAMELNASSLTLDAYTRMEEKSAYLWLKIMKKIAADIDFALEMQIDFMHRLAAVTLQPENKMFEDVDLKYNMLTKKAELAEYLNGGCEIRVWLQNKVAGENEREYVKRLVKLGYTPIVVYPDSELLNHDENNVTKRVLAHPEILTDVTDIGY